jgi:tetratricopeptide (TPR) repeat protein
MGRMQEALADAREAEELAPGSSIAATFVPWISAKARRYEEAVQGWRLLLEMDPQVSYAYDQLIFSLMRLGRMAEAEKAYEVWLNRQPQKAEVPNSAWVAEYEVSAGKSLKVREYVDSMIKQRTTRYVDAYNIAWLYSVLGEQDEAVNWLETAYKEKSAEMYLVNVDPTLDRLRGHPRFEAVVKRMKFPE